MNVKYKVSEVAKDLNVPSKEVIALLGKYVETPKKSVTALTEDELDIVFDFFTQQNQVESFDPYFASGVKKKPAKPKKEAATEKPAEPKPEPKAEPKAEPKPEPKVEPKPEAKPEPAVQKPQPAAFEPKIVSRAADQPRPAPRMQGSAPRQDTPHRGEQPRRDERMSFRDRERERAKEQKKAAKLNRAPTAAQRIAMQSAEAANNPALPKERTVRHVDTRAANVDLDKYNERYESIAPQSKMPRDNVMRKQKINQKSHQRARHQGKRETEAQKLQRLALERARKKQLEIAIPDEIVVSELASRLKVTASEVIKKLMGLGVMAALNQTIDFDTASLVAEELGAKVEREVVVTIEERLIDDSEDKAENLEPRCPVVVVMGHVDHGKTSLLDKIRHSAVTETEAGGITQHIGAYQVETGGHLITFLDTPGHEAFTAMRARGANVTDIAILVVAADDGIMPQTVESINHAKAAGVTVIVAINKIDKPDADPNRVLQQLTEYELVPEEWGGDTICCPVSALTGEGIENLLEMVHLVSEVKDLKANPNRQAKGTVIEARLDKGRGPVATLLVQNGTLHSGDVLIAGTSVGRVRTMTDYRGQSVKDAGPSTPVEITGLAEVPAAGDTFSAVADERLARTLVEQRKHEMKEEEFSKFRKVTLDNLFSQIEEGERKDLPIIVKADVQGSAEAVKQSLEKLSNDEVRVSVIHSAVGAISESDVMLAHASGAVIIGFNVRPDPVARDNAARDEVEIRLYRIIYDAIDDVKQAMRGMLAPKVREVQLGRAEVRQTYHISSVGTVAGCYVLEGKVARNAMIRVVRDGIVIAEDQILSLKRFKDDQKEVAQGYECGIGLEKFNDLKEGDIFESFLLEEYIEE